MPNKSKQKPNVASGTKKEVKFTKHDAKLLPKFTLFFFNRPRLTAILWLAVFLFGIASFTTLLKREGFPAIDIPISAVNGTYIVNDAKTVDKEVAKPISDIAKKQTGVKSVTTQSFNNFFTVIIQFKEGTNAQQVTEQIKLDVQKDPNIPSQAKINYDVPKFGVTGGAAKKIDLAISYYDTTGNKTTEQLTAQAEMYAKQIKSSNLSHVQDVFVQNQFQVAANPLTGQVQTVQKNFDRYGERKDENNKFYNSVIIAITAKDGTDTIKLDDQVHSYLRANPPNSGNTATISASFAPSIKDNLAELQRVLLEGLIAVLIVGSIVIAIRASLITVVSMITVLTATLGVLYLLGYSLNVITLFAIILSLSLIVDDTIIMVEAIDAQRKKQHDPKIAVREATRKVSRAMIAATSTAALSFAPLIFVGGILGSFIRAIPVTIIAALIISLLVALVFIPFFAKFLLLGKKQMGDGHVKEVAAGFESKIASFIARPMVWAKASNKRLVIVGLSALFIGFSFIGAGGFIAKNVVFNIFPNSKDANTLQVNLKFDPGTDIKQAQVIADKANSIVGSTLGSNFETASYYSLADAQKAPLNVNIISYSKRKDTSWQLIDQLKTAFIGFAGAKVSINQVDAGPPASPFTVEIQSENREASFALANDIAKYLDGKQLTRPSGKTAKITEVVVSSPGVFSRTDGLVGISVDATFDGNDTTTLFNLTKTELEKKFTPEKVASYGLGKDAIKFELGQEGENQDSFKTLAIAFPALLFVIFIVLSIEFRSLLQPLLIFMAIPFSFFGISLGLYLTNNPFSFFAMLGFFALIGLSIKNTILLTDYANQARRAGMGGVDAAVEALKERFRPLIATSLTAVVSLIPLAIQSPFWQGLAVVLMFGLLSSTLLVITVFPYYYLGAEYLRIHVSRIQAIVWIACLGLAGFVAIKFLAPWAIGLIVLTWLLLGIGFIIKTSSKTK